MALDSRMRRELISAGHRLRPAVTVPGDPPTDEIVSHVRAVLAHHELIKVRVATEDRERFERVAALLAKKTGGELIQKIGRIVLLHRGAAADGSALTG